MLARYLAEPLEAFTPRTLTDAGALLERLRDVRRDGHAWVHDEYAVGITSVAAPIADARAEIVAAVHVHGPSYRFPTAGDEDRIAAADAPPPPGSAPACEPAGDGRVTQATSRGPGGAGSPTARPREATDRRWVGVVAALVLVGLAFRTQALIIGPLVGQVQAELGMSHGVAGLLGTIPVLSWGSSRHSAVLAASIGPRLGVTICVGFIACSRRAGVSCGGTADLLVATIGIGVGMAVVGPILSIVVRSRLPSAAGAGAFVIGFVIGGASPRRSQCPGRRVRGLAGAFAIVAAAAFMSLRVAAPRAAGRRPHPRRAVAAEAALARPAAWLLGLIFGSQSILFYGCKTWLGSLYVERGWSAAQAGGLIALLPGLGLVSTLAVPAFADRIGRAGRS